MENLGSGLAALGFWLMIAAAVVAGMWFPTRMVRIVTEHEIQKVRLAIESGQIPALETLTKERMAPERKLRVAGSVFLGIGAGTAVLGFFIGQSAPALSSLFYGSGAFLACTSFGLWLGSAALGKSDKA